MVLGLRCRVLLAAAGVAGVVSDGDGTRPGYDDEAAAVAQDVVAWPFDRDVDEGSGLLGSFDTDVDEGSFDSDSLDTFREVRGRQLADDMVDTTEPDFLEVSTTGPDGTGAMKICDEDEQDLCDLSTAVAEEEVHGSFAMVTILIVITVWCGTAILCALLCSRAAKRHRAERESHKIEGFDRPAPNLEDFKMVDPRTGMASQDVPVLGFGELANSQCNAAFLENSFAGPPNEPLCIKARTANGTRRFNNAEAAFRALPFWSRAAEFERLSASQALERSAQLQGTEDTVDAMAGFSLFEGMKTILEAKFRQDTWMEEALLSTRDAFLVYHATEARPWSDGGDGEGENTLGMLLMLVRDKLSAGSSWTDFIKDNFDTETGLPDHSHVHWRWGAAVRAASAALAGEAVAVEVAQAEEVKEPVEEERPQEFLPAEEQPPPMPPPPEPPPVAPPPPKEIVPISMRVSGVDYHRLVSDFFLKADFENEVRAALVHEAGGNVPLDQVKVVLSSGSVLVDAEVPLPGASASRMKCEMGARAKAMEANLAARIAGLPRIRSVQDGQIGVSVLRAYPAKQALMDSNPFLVAETVGAKPPACSKGAGNGQPFLLPFAQDSDSAAWTKPSNRGVSPEDTKRGNKIPLTYRGGVVATKV